MSRPWFYRQCLFSSQKWVDSAEGGESVHRLRFEFHWDDIRGGKLDGVLGLLPSIWTWDHRNSKWIGRERFVGGRRVVLMLSGTGTVEVYLEASSSPFRYDVGGLGEQREVLGAVRQWLFDLFNVSPPTVGLWLVTDVETNVDGVPHAKISGKGLSITVQGLEEGVSRCYLKLQGDGGRTPRLERLVKIGKSVDQWHNDVANAPVTVADRLNAVLREVEEIKGNQGRSTTVLENILAMMKSSKEGVKPPAEVPAPILREDKPYA